MTGSQRATITPAAGWSILFWLMITLSAWFGTSSAVMAAAATDILVTPVSAAAVAPAAVHGEVTLPKELSSSEWQSIRAAYEANRHAVLADDRQRASYRARNPGQQWLSTFNADGVTISPDHDRWQFGLRLARWGHAGQEQAAAPLVGIDVYGQRTVYRYSDGLEEWFVNDQRGLEHGFTVHQPPAGSGHALRFALDITGELSPHVAANGRDVALLDARGNTALDYNKLQVWDADGRLLAANFSSDNRQLILSVDTSAARYPITIDPLLQQQAYLKASNTDGDDLFGNSVAIVGDTVLIGAPREDSNATGVNGDQTDNSATDSGAVYVFVRNGAGNWSQQAYLKASNSDGGDLFGDSVAIFGNTVVVGAPIEASNANGIDGDESDNSATRAGAAYVFVRDGTGNWTQQAYLKASNSDGGDFFGNSVAITGDTVVIGAVGEASTATGVNGNEADNMATFAGAAYVFVRDGSSTWSQQAYLKASNPETFDTFGNSVAVAGDTVVVGAEREESIATGVDGDQSDNSANSSGAAYVFTRDGSDNWSQQAYLKASNTDGGDLFGHSVAIAGDTVLIGARLEASNANGVNGDESDNSASQAGAAYVFVRDGTAAWTQQAYLKASNSDAGDVFGSSVALAGDTVVIGARAEDSNASGVAGDQIDNSANDAGAAYVFVRDGTGTWTQQAYLKASNTDAGDEFGSSMAIAGDTVVMSARFEDSNASGIAGGEVDNSASAAGAVYVFDMAFTIGGTVSGLAGSGLVLQSNAGDDLAITTDGAFTFDTALFNGNPYDVTVLNQPGGLSQTCSVTNASGTITGADVTNVQIDCTTNTFSIGGTVSGLAGSGLVLQNNGGDDLAIAADDGFIFATDLADGSAYSVSVQTHPADLSQTCTVANASGTLMGGNVSNIEVTCSTNQFTIGGTISGLDGNGLLLQNNAADNLVATVNGPFTLPTALVDGSDYNVTLFVLVQPGAPSQSCTLSNGSGTLAGADVTNVAVNCVTDQFTVGGTVTGLGGSSLVLQNNGGDDLAIAANGPFTFAAPLDDGSSYTVTVATQPSNLGRFCSVINGSGTLAGANVTSVFIDCEPISIEVMPTRFVFADIEVGASSPPQMVVIENTGEVDVAVQSITLTGFASTDFALSMDTCSAEVLDPGEFCGFELVFTPTIAGVRRAEIIIDTDLFAQPFRVDVLGTSNVVFFDGFEDIE